MRSCSDVCRQKADRKRGGRASGTRRPAPPILRAASVASRYRHTGSALTLQVVAVPHADFDVAPESVREVDH
jgi:hypothetical protein